jgi:hypothetical protein
MNISWKLIILVICLFIFHFEHGCLEEENGGIIRMTFAEFITDYHQDYINSTGNLSSHFRGWYSSLNAGDTVIIEDTLREIEYSDTYDTTYVEFTSLGTNKVQFPVEGDLWNTFQEGDIVTITLHIIHVDFTQSMSNGESMSVDIETYKEGWDSLNNLPVPVPQQYIQPA